MPYREGTREARRPHPGPRRPGRRIRRAVRRRDGQAARRGPPGRARGERPLRRDDRRRLGADDRARRAPAPAARPDCRRRRSRPADAACARGARPSSAREPRAPAGPRRLGRLDDAVHARVARLPVGNVRRRLRAADGAGRSAVPALGADRRGRPAGPDDLPRAPRASPPRPHLAQPARGDRRHGPLRATGPPLPHGAGLPRGPRGAGARGGRRPSRRRALDLGRLREPRGRPAPAPPDDVVRASVADRRPARRVDLTRDASSAASARREPPPARTCTSSCGRAARR